MGPPPKPSEAGSVGRGGPAEGMSFRVYAEANDPQLGPTMWGATTRRAVRLPGCPRGRAAFLKVASLDFYRKRPRRLRLGRGTAFDVKSGGKTTRAAALDPGLMAAVGCTELAKTGSASPPAPLALAAIGAPAEAQRSTRKGHTASVRRQSRQRLRSGFGGESFPAKRRRWRIKRAGKKERRDWRATSARESQCRNGSKGPAEGMSFRACPEANDP